MTRQVRLARPAQKQLDALPREDYRRVHEKLKALAEAPRPPGCVKIDEGLYRIRCGPYRILYSILEPEGLVLIVKVARRSERTYRGLV